MLVAFPDEAWILVGVHHSDVAASNSPPQITHRHPGRYV